MAKKDEMLELAKKQSDALLEADLAAMDEQTQREMNDALALEALSGTHKAESDALAAHNQAQYNNVGQIISDVEGQIATAKQKDETARRRENAFRYISGLGDTLSGVANLIGTAHGAANQKQTYNSNAVVQKAEQARKARKIEIDDLSKRLDELTARQKDLKAAGSLAEVQLKAKQDRETYKLQAEQRAKADEAKRYADAQAHTAMREARADWAADRAFNAQQENLQKTYNMQYAKFKDEQQKNKDAKTFPFSVGNGEFVEIPKDRINETSVRPIFEALPDEFKKLAKGKAVTTYDEFGNRQTEYATPTIEEKIAAISVAAQSDPAILSEVKKLAGASVGKTNTDTVALVVEDDSGTAPAYSRQKAVEDDIIENGKDSFYIKGNKYAKIKEGDSSFTPKADINKSSSPISSPAPGSTKKKKPNPMS